MVTFRNFSLILTLAGIFWAGCGGGENASPPFMPGNPLYTISGTVTGAWHEGVTITLISTETKTVTTNAGGSFQLSTFTTGTYTIVPSLEGYSFIPSDQTVFLSGKNVKLSDFVSKSTLTSYAVSGTVTYEGVYTGPNTGVYIGLWKDGQPSGRGTSIVSGGTYTIRGVPAGTYVLNADMDIMGTGSRNANDPTGMISSVTVTDYDLTGQDIVLHDVVAPSPTPSGLVINPGVQSAIIAWNGNYDVNRKETATAYKIYWGPDESSLSSSVIVPAYGKQLYFQSIPDGTYSYIISSLVGTFESAASSVVGPVTVGAGAGLNNISGTVTIPLTPTGPLYVGVYDSKSHFYFTSIPSPSRTQPYSVSGVPNGAYQSFAVIDMNNDGFLDSEDMSVGIKNNYQLIVVNDADVTWDPVVPFENAVTYVNTNHWQTGAGPDDYYSLKFEVDGNRKRPVNVVLASGPNVSVPMDIMRPSLSNPMAFSAWVKSGPTGSVRPMEGDIYKFKVTYSDKTSEILTGSVTAVLDSNTFAQNLQVVTNPSTTVPTFSWEAPISPPDSYTYVLEVWRYTSTDWYWLYPQNASGMPSSITTTQFNVDTQQNIPESLAMWTPYVWTVFVMDRNGNLSQSFSTYTPLPSLP